ncbi:hypothetical protein ABN273_28810, partial [Nonomuraea sp. B19D2]
MNDWLSYGLNGRDEDTIKLYPNICRTHVVPGLGKRKLRDLRAEDGDKWLAAKAVTLSTRTLQIMHSCLNRAIKRAMARDKVKRNVVELCNVPTGTAGRPSKALTFAQADAVLQAAEGTRMHAYIVLSLLTGARTEELRALTWDHVDLDGDSILLVNSSQAARASSASSRRARWLVRVRSSGCPFHQASRRMR